MPSSTLNASVVGPGVHNVVLRKALIHSPVDRVASASSYHKIEVGIREGAYTTWIGSWDQSAQYLGGGSPLSVLDEGRDGMRLRAGQTIVVRVTATGVPFLASLDAAVPRRAWTSSFSPRSSTRSISAALRMRRKMRLTLFEGRGHAQPVGLGGP